MPTMLSNVRGHDRRKLFAPSLQPFVYGSKTRCFLMLCTVEAWIPRMPHLHGCLGKVALPRRAQLTPQRRPNSSPGRQELRLFLPRSFQKKLPNRRCPGKRSKLPRQICQQSRRRRLRPKSKGCHGKRSQGKQKLPRAFYPKQRPRQDCPGKPGLGKVRFGDFPCVP